jgi:hypothetical protein
MPTTLEEAKQIIRECVKSGEAMECPCCSQMVKVYKRKLNSGMAKSLLLIYKISNKIGFDYIHVQDEFKKLGINAISLEYNKLEHWRLIEKRKGENPSGANRSGWWKLTPLGISFAKNGSKVQESVFVYDAKVCGFTGPEINITKAINNKFDYYQLMGFLPLNELEGGTP